MPIVNRVADLHPEITAWRRDLHAHPELLYDVHRTAASVAEKLKAFGCDEVVPGLGLTGVVGVIRGRKQGSGENLLLHGSLLNWGRQGPGRKPSCARTAQAVSDGRTGGYFHAPEQSCAKARRAVD